MHSSVSRQDQKRSECFALFDIMLRALPEFAGLKAAISRKLTHAVPRHDNSSRHVCLVTASLLMVQEEGGRQMVTHSRVMEHVVRKPDDRRKRKRAEKAERKAGEQTTQQQEVKRLKNLKSQEIQDRYILMTFAA